MRRNLLQAVLTSLFTALALAPAAADSTAVTAALNAPSVSVGGNASFQWGPIVSQGNMSLQGASSVLYPQKFAGGWIKEGSSVTHCANPSDPTSGPGTPYNEWYCDMPNPPAYPQINFDDYRNLAMAEGSSCGGQPCLNPTVINPDPVCTVSGQPKVWFFDTNVSISGGYFCGVLVSKGAVTFTGTGSQTLTTTPPSNAWMQYEVGTPSGGPDTAALGEYPGDSGFQQSNAPVSISKVSFQGYIYATTGYKSAGGTVIVGAVQFGQNASSSFGGSTIYFSTQTIIVQPPNANQVDQPIIFPGTECSANPVTVTLIDSTSGAPIYYTLDGSMPTPSSTLYTGPFPVNGPTTTIVTAIAFPPSGTTMTASQPASATYTFSAACGTPNPAPVIQSIVPGSATAGSSGFTLTVNGSHFLSGAVVTWNGANRTTSLVNQSQLTASIVATDVQTAGTAAVQVENPDTQLSNVVTFTVTPVTSGNPAPALSSLSPSSVSAGSPGFTMTVNGSNFVSGSTVTWNGGDRITSFVDGGHLTIFVPGTDVAAAGSAAVQVRNPDFQLSNTLTFTITTVSGGNPAPVLNSLMPSSAVAGSSDFTLNVGGQNFLNGAIVTWNGSDQTTTVISAQQLSADIPASDIVSAGTANVQVRNPDTQVSNTLPFTITSAPSPTVQFSAASYSTTEDTGVFRVTLIRQGLDLSKSTTVQFRTDNGTAMVGVNYVGVSGLLVFNSGDTTMTFDVPIINDGQADGNKTVLLSLSNPVGGTLGTPSNATLTITDVGAAPVPPTPFISQIMPYSAPVDFNLSFTMRIMGTGFDPIHSLAFWAGTPLTVVARTTSTVDVTVLPSDWNNTPGNYGIMVQNPGPLNSNIVPYTILPVFSGTPPPYIVDAATASPNPTSFNYTNLSVKGGSLSCVANGACLTYTWNLVETNPSINVVYDSRNGQSTGTQVKVAFPMPGTYHFQATVTDTITHLSALSNVVDVVVLSKAAILTLSPKFQIITPDQTPKITATVFDQFGSTMTPTLQWNNTAGSLSVSGTSAVLSVNPTIRNVHITATTQDSSLSDYADVTVVFGSGGTADLNHVTVGPVPFKSTSGLPGVTFHGLNPGIKIRIFSPDGRLITTLISGTSSDLLWNLTNLHGTKVASGVYLYIIDGDGQTRQGKLVLIL